MRSSSVKTGLIAMTLLFIAMLVPVHAQAEVMDPAVSASTGTIYAAALETIGYAAQAKVLKTLGTMLKDMGALVYFCCLVSAIFTVSMMGVYRTARWLLIGPVLFFYLTDYTTRAAGAEWQFGVFKDEKKRLEDYLEGVDYGMNAKAEKPEVSWVFHRYNMLVSDVVQSLVRVITNNSMRSQMKFMARQNILDELFLVDIGDSGLLALTKYMMAHCSDMLDDARMVSHGERYPEYKSTNTYQEAVRRYCEFGDKRTIRMTGGPWLDFINRLRFGPVDLDNLDRTLPEDVREGDQVSCQDLWSYMVKGVYEYEQGYYDETEDKFVPIDADDAIVREIRLNIKQKLVALKPDQTAFSCPGGGDDTKLHMPDNRSKIAAIIAGYLIRKALIEDPRSNMISSFARRGGIHVGHFEYDYHLLKPDEQLEYVRRHKTHELAEQEKIEIVAAAMTLPQIQGLFLYVLGLLFPFFALTVIVPGKAGTFFMWMALWAWAKSWDVGWAFVMVVDDVLWELMPRSTIYGLHVDGVAARFDPVTVLEAAFHGDHAFNLAMYYALISSMLFAVPLLSAEAVLGTKKAVAGVLINGLKGLGEALGGSWADYVSHVQVHKADQKRHEWLINRTVPHLMAPFNKDVQSTLEAAKGQEAAGDALQKSGGGAAAGYAATALLVVGALACGVAIAATGGLALGAVAFGGIALSKLAFWGAVGGALAIGVGSTMGSRAQSHKDEGVAHKRVARSVRTPETYRMNAQQHYYAAQKSERAIMWDTIRAGLSVRGEWWNIPDVAPVGVKEALHNMREITKAEMGQLNSAGWGNNIHSAVHGATEGVEAYLNATRVRRVVP